MDIQEILKDLTQTLRDMLADDTIVLTESTRRADVPNWDSFTYVNFIVAIELKYDMKFTVAEVESFENVGAIAARVLELLG